MRKLFLKRSVAWLLCLVLTCAMLPVSVFAAESENPYGIEGENITVEEINASDGSLSAIQAEAAKRAFGMMIADDWATTYGHLLQTFKITSEKDIVSFKMNKPVLEEDDLGAQSYATAGERYKILIQDAENQSAPIYVFSTELSEDKQSLSVTIPTLGGKINCAVAQYNTTGYYHGYTADGTYFRKNSVTPSVKMADSGSAMLHYEWIFQGTSTGSEFSPFSYSTMDATIQLNVGKLVLDRDSIAVETPAFDVGGIADGGSGNWTIKLVKSSTATSDNLSTTNGITEEIKVSFDAALPSGMTQGSEVYVIAELLLIGPAPGVSNSPQSIGETAPLVPQRVIGINYVVENTSTVVGTGTILAGMDDSTISVKDLTAPVGYELAVEGDTVEIKENVATVPVTLGEDTKVTVTPADIIVYMGGESYEGAVNEGGTIVSSSGLPEPGFTIALPDGVTVEDLKELEFKEMGGGDRTWTLEPYDGQSTDIYKLVPGDPTSPTRMQFIKEDGNVISSDEFEVGREVNTSFGMKLYHDDNTGTISVEINGVTYPVESTPGTLYVRGTTDDVIISSVGTTAPANGQPGAVADPNTTYTINDSDVQVVGGNVSLLFDEIINNQGDDRTGQLKARAERELPQLSGNRDYAYEFKYLDLVDASNGNAWVKASDNLTIYWPLPEGADVDTLQVLHFKDLHRNMVSGIIEGSIANCAVETISCQVSGDYVTFDIGSGGFSPFALVWEERGPIVPPTTYYTITATAGEGGAIAPDGTVRVAQGADRTFTISAAEGYVIADVLVDGESIGAVDSYTFENVRQNHTIEARFQPVSDVADPDDTGVSDWLNTDDHLAYLDGYPGNTFQPEEDMTRAEAAQMFYNLLRDQDVDTTVSFTDVAADAWYAEAVNTLATLEIVDGVGDNRFAPERTITRAEFTTMAMRFCQEIPTGENIFSDVDQDDWFYDYVVGSIQYGWINGYPDGTFRPNDTITRAEVTTIANRMLGRAADEAYVDGHQDQLRAFPDVTKGYWAYYDITEATNAHTYTQDSQGEDWTGLA